MSLFERFQKAGYPVQMLKIQYRMNPQVFVSLFLQLFFHFSATSGLFWRGFPEMHDFLIRFQTEKRELFGEALA